MKSALAAALIVLMTTVCYGIDPIRVSSSPQHFAVIHSRGVHVRVTSFSPAFAGVDAGWPANAWGGTVPTVTPNPTWEPAYGYPTGGIQPGGGIQVIVPAIPSGGRPLGPIGRFPGNRAVFPRRIHQGSLPSSR